MERLLKGAKQLPPLLEGDHVSIQDQSGHTPKRWSKTGSVDECAGHDSYLIKVDGSQRLTRHNRQFLRKLDLYRPDPDIQLAPLPIPVALTNPVGPVACPADPPDVPAQDDPDLVQQQPLCVEATCPPDLTFLPDVQTPDSAPPPAPPLPAQPRWPRINLSVKSDHCRPASTAALPS